MRRSEGGARMASHGKDIYSLEEMLAEKKRRSEANAKIKERVEKEVDKMMDNGVRVNPKLVAMLGGAHMADFANKERVESELGQKQPAAQET